jgi:hypothetical protein
MLINLILMMVLGGDTALFGCIDVSPEGAGGF